MEFAFEWDPTKAAANARKHCVTFVEASTVFGDPLSATLPDPDRFAEEVRSLTFGRSSSGRMLVVATVERGDRIRLISAREMTPKERRNYGEGTHGTS